MKPKSETFDYKLNQFKTFNKFGLKRRFKPTKRQVDNFKASNDWEEFGNENLLVFRDYKACYITIMKNKNGQYEPSVSGCKINSYPGKINLKAVYTSLEEAKSCAFAFVDKMTERNK